MRPWPHLAACALLVTSACTASSDEVSPPSDQIFGPTGIAVAPDETVAFVTSANSELRYDSGTVAVIDLAAVQSRIAMWTNSKNPGDELCKDGDDTVACCEADPDHRETLICDESLFLNVGAGVRIGNFATDIGIQDLGGGGLRLMIPTRGDPSVAWADWDGSKLSCNSSGEANALCDDDHRLTYVDDDADLASIPEEPFNVFADSAGEFAMVTHLTTGAVTLIDSPRSGGKVQVTDVLGGVFAADPATGIRGATGIVGRLPNAGGDTIYVGSRSENRIQTFTVGRPLNDPRPFLLPGNWFFLNQVGVAADPSRPSYDTRGMAESVDGSRLYVVNRHPPTLQVWDTTLGATGFPKNDAVGATDICRQGSQVTISGSGDAERAYVTCFQDGQVYVVDPRAGTSVEDIILTGRGPFAIAAARTRHQLFVTNFLEDTVAVVDTAPDSPTHNRVVLRIGKVKPP